MPFQNPVQSNPTQTIIHRTDGAPVKRAVYDTRSQRDEAVERGALILRRLSGHAAWTRVSASAMLILHRLCAIHGSVEEWCAGVVVRDDAGKIAEAMQTTKNSLYRPLVALEECGLIQRIKNHGNAPDYYAVPMLEPSEEERAELAEKVAAENAAAGSEPSAGAQMAAQSALRACKPSAGALMAAQSALRASNHLLARSAICAAKTLTDNELALRASNHLLARSAQPTGNAGFSTENPHYQETGSEMVSNLRLHDDDDDDHHTWSGEMPPAGAEGRELGQAAESRIAGLLPGADEDRIFTVLRECKIDEGPARTWAKKIGLIDATALAIIRRKKGERLGGGWAINRLKGLDGGIEAWAKTEAARRLGAGKKPPEPRPDPKIEQNRIADEEAALERAIGGIPDDELAQFAAAVLEKYQGNAAVINVLTKKPPRQCRLMKMEIAAMCGLRKEVTV